MLVIRGLRLRLHLKRADVAVLLVRSQFLWSAGTRYTSTVHVSGQADCVALGSVLKAGAIPDVAGFFVTKTTTVPDDALLPFFKARAVGHAFLAVFVLANSDADFVPEVSQTMGSVLKPGAISGLAAAALAEPVGTPHAAGRSEINSLAVGYDAADVSLHPIAASASTHAIPNM